MLLNETPEQVANGLGTDGNEVIEKGYTRSFHFDEILDYVFKRTKCYLVPIARHPAIQFPKSIYSIFDDDTAKKRFYRYMAAHRGILILEGPRHACAWDGKMVHDPHSKIYELKSVDSRIFEAWILT